MPRNVSQQYVQDGVLYTICKPQAIPKGRRWSNGHLGKSNSSIAKFTGRHNHG